MHEDASETVKDIYRFISTNWFSFWSFCHGSESHYAKFPLSTSKTWHGKRKQTWKNRIHYMTCSLLINLWWLGERAQRLQLHSSLPVTALEHSSVVTGRLLECIRLAAPSSYMTSDLLSICVHLLIVSPQSLLVSLQPPLRLPQPLHISLVLFFAPL